MHNDRAIANLQPLVLSLVQGLVDEPEAVTLEPCRLPSEIVFHVYVSKGDVGKLIGKQGRTARAMRTILASASMKYAQHCALDIHTSDI